MERDAAEAIAMLRSRDSSGAYDDIIDMFSRLGQKAKRLVQVVTCRQTDDVFTERRAAPRRERPPRPTMATRGRGASLDQTAHTAAPHPDIAGTSSWHEQSQPRTPAAATAAPTSVHEVPMSTPGPLLQPTMTFGGFAGYNAAGGFTGYNLAPGTSLIELCPFRLC